MKFACCSYLILGATPSDPPPMPRIGPSDATLLADQSELTGTKSTQHGPSYGMCGSSSFPRQPSLAGIVERTPWDDDASSPEKNRAQAPFPGGHVTGWPPASPSPILPCPSLHMAPGLVCGGVPMEAGFDHDVESLFRYV